MEIIILILVVLLIWSTLSSQTCAPSQTIQLKPRTVQDELDDLEATKKLEENYRFIKPKYAGFYMGEKIKKGDPRLHEMMSDPTFCRDTGKWVPRGNKK